ncbi:MAG: DNA-binding protein [Vicinamibacterales bacterium]
MDDQSGPRYSERWHSVEEVTAHLDVAGDTVYRRIECKGLSAHRIGMLSKFKLPEVGDWVRSGAPNREHIERTRRRRVPKS